MIQDSLTHQAGPVDSVVEHTLFGDRITPIIQWIFQRSPWIMWGGVILGMAVLAVAVRWLWPRRKAIWTWLRTRGVGVKVALAAGLAVVVLGVAGAGYKSYDFVETDSRFCNGCHIFVPSGQVWVGPDTGNYTIVPRLEGKHDSLSCHTCHPLNPRKEALKLVLWMSGVRGDSIPPHAKVPRAICEQCHVQGQAKETWQEIAATAGHRTHLESDSLKGKIECLTCHARTAHRFVPVNQTCGQSGCHSPDETRIVLGKMSAQDQASSFHCQACHNFVALVPRLATRDSAVGTLRPGLQQCFACHAMKVRLPDFNPERDPHKGSCGMCHDPHRQHQPPDAKKSCTTAGCHDDWRGEPFHTGVAHHRVAEQCLTCHPPHAARVDASDCTGCHVRVQDRKAGLTPPLPFDTLKALERSTVPQDERPQRPKGDGPILGGLSPAPAVPFPSPPRDTFPHDRHTKLTCLTCHLAASGRGSLTFEPPRGCQLCHHEDPGKKDCRTCHAVAQTDPPIAVPVSIQVPKEPPRARSVEFRHETHAELNCIRCHATPVTLAPVDSAVTCQACHADHHAAGRDCATCHKTDAIRGAHETPAFAHVKCTACHTPARIARLTPTRSFCLACHDQAQDHYAPKECTTCHFLRTPDAFHQDLVRGRAR